MTTIDPELHYLNIQFLWRSVLLSVKNMPLAIYSMLSMVLIDIVHDSLNKLASTA